MGRRAADLTTPVPVLGVPALVGVRAWKTTGGDRSGGALLQTWGLQCSVGVQTSPGISRPPTELPDTLSDNITQTTNGYITKETEEILPLTRSDNEKKAILKLKTGESKIKKEVTFKACGGDASKDVPCSHRNSGETYCYARAIKTNPLIAGTVTSGRPKLKSAARYTNGSVVDSEAIGGINIANNETEPVKGAVFHGRDLQDHYADQSGKMLPLSDARPFAMPQKICEYCGGRQSVTSRAAVLGENSPCLGKKLNEKPLKPPFTSLFTTNHFEAHHTEKKVQTNQQISQSILSIVKKTQVTANPQTLHLNEELRCRRTPHPACPVHSRGNLESLSHGCVASNATPTQPATTLHTKTITKAIIESRPNESSVKCFNNPPPNDKNNLQTSLTLNFPITKAIKPNYPYSQTHPKVLKITHHNSTHDGVPQNVCVSVHAAPENTQSSHSTYTVAMGVGSTSTTGTHKTNATSEEVSTNNNVTEANIQHKTLNSLDKAQRSKTTNIANGPKVVPKCPTSLLSTSTFDHIYKAEPPAHLTNASPPFDSHKPPEKPHKISAVDSVVRATVFPAFANSPHTTAPHTLVSTMTHEAKSNQMNCLSSRHKPNAAQMHSNQPNSSMSEPVLNVSASSPHTTSGASTTLNSAAELCTSEALSSTLTCNNNVCKNIAHKTIAFDIRKLDGSSSSPCREKQNNISISSRTLFQSKEHRYNEAAQANKAHHKQTTDIRTQFIDKSNVLEAFPDHKNNTRGSSLISSEAQNLSENHQGGSDACNHNPKPKPTIDINDKLYSDINKVSGNLINELVVHESKLQENPNLSQVTNPQNYISLIKSGSSCLQGCLNTKQQRLTHCQGYIGTNHEGHCATSPPVKTSQPTDSNTEQFALSASAGHANTKLKSNSDGQAHPNYSLPSVTSQTNSEPIMSHMNAQVKPLTISSACRNSDFDNTLQALSSPEHFVTEHASFSSEGDCCAQVGPECDSVLLSSTIRLASSFPFQSSEVESIIRPDSKFSPAPSQLCPEDTSLAHSHPVNAALLLPPSPQCCKSAALQQRLEAVEASLAANKDRITTLLNIIHDLETCCTPTSRQRSNKTGQDLKNCSTCQKTACIVYSVEYDFRQQERRFLDILNCSANGSNVFSVHLAQPLNLNLLRNIISKNLTKTKLKSKKLCNTLLKWLPRKIQQL